MNSIAKRQDLKVLEGGKYGSNNGFDHVLVSANGEVTILLDSKQIASGSVSMGATVSGAVQMTDKWVLEVLGKLDQGSEAYKAVSAAYDAGALVKGVAGVDRASGHLIIMRVK